MPLEQLTNGATATLTAPIAAHAAAATVTIATDAAIGLANGRHLRLRIEGELFLVTAGMGTTSMTATAAVEGSTPDSHPAGVTVTQIVTPAGLANTPAPPEDHGHTATDDGGTVAHSALTGVTANQHHNQAHSLTGADHTMSGLTTGHVLTATGPTAAAFQAPAGGGGAPAAHATTHQPGGSDTMAVDAAAGTGSLRTLGTSGTSAAAGNDSRLSDSRAPTAHATTHVGGGGDAIAAFVASGAGHKSGLVPDPGATGGATKFLREDASWQVPAGGGGTLTVEEVDGTPSVAATKLILPNGTVSVTGTEATYTPGGGGGGGSTISRGAYASLPAAGTSGNLYLPTDSYYEHLYDNGASWEHFLRGRKVTPPPAVAALTWVNQGDATTDETYGGVYLEQGSGTSSASERLLVQSAPSTPWTRTWALRTVLSVAAGHLGVVLRESSTGKYIGFGFYGSVGAAPYVSYFNSPTSWSSHAYGANVIQGHLSGANPWFLRVNDDGTNLKFLFSADGVHFVQLFSVSRTAWLTGGPNQIGIGVDNNNSAGVYGLTWLGLD